MGAGEGTRAGSTRAATTFWCGSELAEGRMDMPKRLVGNAATRGWVLILSSAILVCGGWACLHYEIARPPARTYRMGF